MEISLINVNVTYVDGKQKDCQILLQLSLIWGQQRAVIQVCNDRNHVQVPAWQRIGRNCEGQGSREGSNRQRGHDLSLAEFLPEKKRNFLSVELCYHGRAGHISLLLPPTLFN